MLGREELNRLALRRRELVLRSSLNRLAMRAEMQSIQTALEPADRIITKVRAARPWLLLLAPVAGILAARSLRGQGAGLWRVLGWLKWVRPLLEVWKQFKVDCQESPPSPGPVG